MSIRPSRLTQALALGALCAMSAGTLVACSTGGGTSDSAAGDDCEPAHEFETVKSGSLTVASYDYPPATEILGDSEITGFEGDLLTEFAEVECLTLAVTSAGGAAAVIPSIETGRADIGAGAWYRTNDREKIVRLSEPTAIDASAIVSLNDYGVDDLEGMKVGSVSGFLWNDSLQKKFGDDFTIYQDEEAIYGDLSAGRLDVVVTSVASAALRFESNPIDGATVVTTEPLDGVPEFERQGQLTFPTNLDNAELGEAIDAFVLEARESGRIAELLEEYGMDPELADITEVWNL